MNYSNNVYINTIVYAGKSLIQNLLYDYIHWFCYCKINIFTYMYSVPFEPTPFICKIKIKTVNVYFRLQDVCNCVQFFLSILPFEFKHELNCYCYVYICYHKGKKLIVCLFSSLVDTDGPVKLIGFELDWTYERIRHL